ncbi:hypothetical protein ACM66B_002299 [Microbotryomycetes sp. NB124-2]
MAVDHDFMQDLFADLDSSAFDTTVLSSSPPKCTIKRVQPPVEPVARAVLPSRARDSAQSGQAQQQQQQRPSVATTTARARPSASTSTPSQFWDNPYSRPVVNSKNGHKSSTTTSLRGPTKHVTARSSTNHSNLKSDAKRNETVAHGPRPVKHVSIAVQPSVLAAGANGGDKGKGRATNDHDDLLQGVDWDEEDWQTSQAAVQGREPSESPPDNPKSLALSQQYTRCSVTDVENAVDEQNRRPYRILTIESKAFDHACKAHVRDDWLQTEVQAGDTINIVGNIEPANDPAVVIDRNSGMLILYPDILVSSTKVGDSANCSRKAVLQELIRTLGGSNKSLVYGNMLHELMQACMLDDQWHDEYRRNKIQEIIQSQIQLLWSIDLETSKAYEDMLDKSKEFDSFKSIFINKSNVPRLTANIGDSRADKATSSRLAITEALSVEEDIWSPKYGLKGKIDVSVAGVVATNTVERKEPSTMPFEIKTGRTNAGMEHRAQTMLYTLLMSDRYNEEIASGLLYYSQSNSVVRVQAARNELRGLIIARNEFATYLHRRMTLCPSGPHPSETQHQSPPPMDVDVVKLEYQSPAAKAATPELSDDEEAMWAAAGGSIVASQDVGDIEDEPQLLPAAVDDARMCRKCYIKDACMLFRSAVDGDECISEDPASELQSAFEEKTSFLTKEHKTFFKQWEKLVSLEEQEVVRNKKEIWTMSAEERMKAGRCLANMSIDPTFVPKQDGPRARIHRHTYRLHHAVPLLTQATASQHAARSLLGGAIKVNDPVIVSLEDPYVLGIARGFVLELDARSIVVGLDRPLETTPQAARSLPPSTKPQDLVFRIDEDELAAGLGRLRDNLIQLFVTDGDERRRRLVVDLAPPEFETGRLRTDEAVRDKFSLNHLNSDQQAAVEKVLSARDYALILGMPGTGKTTAIAEIVKAFADCGKSILLTAYTHSAVDNVLLKLADSSLSILRLGNRDKIMPQLHHHTLDPANMPQTLTQVDNLLMMPQVVATTCSGINEPIFTKRHFDVCIVDEASQVTLPACLGPLRFADTFVLVGDHNQLPPLVRNKAARQGGLDVSLFKRLSDAHPQAVCNLSLQYRMNEDIMLLSNRLIYQDQLKCGSKDVAERKLALPFKHALRRMSFAPARDLEWLATVVDPERAVVFLDTDEMVASESRMGSRVSNPGEAKLVAHSAEALLRCGVRACDIGVITPYRQQLKLLSRKLEHVPDIEVLTADRSQGRDKECIIMSLVRSNEDKVVGDLLKDWRRINVCLTRAKTKIVLIGSRSTLTNLPLLHKFFELVDEREWQVVVPRQVNTWIPGCVLASSPKLKRTSSSPVAVKSDAISASSPARVKIENKENNMSSTPASGSGVNKVRKSDALPFSSSPLLRDKANLA